MTPKQLVAAVAEMHNADLDAAHITATLGIEREQVERIIDRLDGVTHSPYRRDLLGPRNGHVPHNPDLVALKAEQAERAIENTRTRRLNVEMGLTVKASEAQMAGYARYRNVDRAMQT